MKTTKQAFETVTITGTGNGLHGSWRSPTKAPENKKKPVKLKPPAQREGPILKATLQILELNNIWHQRMNSGKKVIGEGKARRMLNMSEAGTPDIFVYLGYGRIMGLEVKSPTGTQSQSQRDWQAKAGRHGITYVVVRSALQALLEVKKELAKQATQIRGH